MSNPRKAQRQSANSVYSRVKGYSEEKELVEPPIGVEFQSEAEWTLWRQYTLVRASSDWRDTDLLLLAKIVGYELEIRDLTSRILEGEAEIDDKTGKRRLESKLRTTRDIVTKQLIQMLRNMNINSLASDPRTVNKAGMGKRVSKVDKAKVTLLASPDGWE